MTDPENNFHNIGKPRAFGQALGKAHARLNVCYDSYAPGSKDAQACISGYFEGEHRAFIGIISTEPPQTPPDGQEGA